jgi:2-(1,2-epoxy-1,2-dihydrophenyl)acetyl-CoA isomerase
MARPPAAIVVPVHGLHSPEGAATRAACIAWGTPFAPPEDVVPGGSRQAGVMLTREISLTVDHGVARLTLARPDAGNALNHPVVAQLRAHAEALAARDDVRVVVLRGEGRNFCVGGDLAYFAGIDDIESEILQLATDFHAGIETLRGLGAPLIAGVQGAAAGGGLSLACMCDLVLAAESARFTMAYTGAGLSPDGGASWFLPRIVGLRLATEMLLTNRVLSSVEAATAGIVTTVVPDEALDAEVDALADRLRRGAAGAYASVKRLLQGSATASLHEHLEAEARAIATNAAHPDGREGVAAFLARRDPQFA